MTLNTLAIGKKMLSKFMFGKKWNRINLWTNGKGAHNFFDFLSEYQVKTIFE